MAALSTGLNSDIPPPLHHNNINSHRGNRKDTRNRRGMRETGCGATKICPRQNKNAHCKMIRHSGVCRRKDSRFFGSDYSISQTCRRSSNCAC